jgi:hypothetical protein
MQVNAIAFDAMSTRRTENDFVVVHVAQYPVHFMLPDLHELEIFSFFFGVVAIEIAPINPRRSLP